MTVESLKPITADELLSAVKSVLNITGAQFDNTLQFYIEDVKGYLTSAGVATEVLGSTLAVGCIARGVADLWNYGNGDTKLSEYFYQRAEQLRSKVAWKTLGDVEVTTIILPAGAWAKAGESYTQVAEISGVTVNSRVDLQLTEEQLSQLADVTLTTANVNGVVTVFADGGKPTADYTVQAVITEV